MTDASKNDEERLSLIRAQRDRELNEPQWQKVKYFSWIDMDLMLRLLDAARAEITVLEDPCFWHPGHEPEEWFREEKELRSAALRQAEQNAEHWAKRCAALTKERDEARKTLLEELDFGRIVMMSEQRAKAGQPPRWCVLVRESKEAVYANTEEEARRLALHTETRSSTPHSSTTKNQNPP